MNTLDTDWTDLHLPAVRFLGHERYRTMVTPNGRGFSRFRDLALNPWSHDAVQGRTGLLVYLRDASRGGCWLCGDASGNASASPASAAVSLGAAQVRDVHHGIECRVDICVPPNADLELRRIALHNQGGADRTIEVTTYLEVALHQPMAYASHPAFSKLFVQTEFLGAHHALLARRRPRGSTDASPFMVQALLGPGELQYETNRAAFIGRGYPMDCPRAFQTRDPLASGIGNVLDPVFAMRRSVSVPAHGSVELMVVLGGAETREDAMALIQQRVDVGVFETAVRDAASHDIKILQSLELTPEQALRYQALAGAMYRFDPRLGAAPDVRRRAAGHMGILWAHGLPTDSPLAVIDSRDEAEISHWANVQRYWRSHGLDTTLLLLTGEKSAAADADADPGRCIVKLGRSDIPAAQLDVMLTVACLVAGSGLSLPSAVPTGSMEIKNKATSISPSASQKSSRPVLLQADKSALRFDNGHGGFSADGREYIIRLQATEHGLNLPPLPWVNVMANPKFGCLVSETGAGCTWSRNSHEWRLTPWSNDPVIDPHGEALYLRDETTGRYWSPMPGPAPSGQNYEVHHGFGYSRFLHRCDDLDQQTTVFVAREDPVKIVRLSLTNLGDTLRTLSIVSFQRLVLGFLPLQSSRFIQTSMDGGSALLFAKNPMGGDFASGVAFAATVSDVPELWQESTDRQSFLGPLCDPAKPEALTERDGILQGRAGVYDPCFAQKCTLTLGPGECAEVSFLLGECATEDQVRKLAAKYREPGAIDQALTDVMEFWSTLLSGVRIETPCPAVDFMVNGWLPYQNLSCRMWGRTAFHQSSGAFGFRDQLQDAAALVHLRPEITREQILIHAAHQYVEGDVMHWWHPQPSGFGLRTHFSDDLNWLPYVTAFYVKTTGDASVLDERRAFLKGRLLEPGEDETGMKAELAAEQGDVYEHCCRALDRSLTKGAHGLPLMGTGDWNDGMNRVGREGRGESVWMGFFLYHILGEFLPLCERRGDKARIERYIAYRNDIHASLNDTGWDGEWYRRAYYDDGTPLGSHENDECKIDALAQSWAVISGAATPERANQAMDAVEKHLVDEKGRLIRLLTPAFVNTPHDPGYIKGYVAGVRENGGQYTHAACWVVKALAELGRTERAAKLLEMLSPVSHAGTKEGAELFKLEPYVVAADVYGEPPHVGRGGWSWYTGSAGWLYRVAVESVLGLSTEGGTVLVLKPCLPAAWTTMRMDYTMPDRVSVLRIEVSNPRGGRKVVATKMDGAAVPVVEGAARFALLQDGSEHRAEVVLG